MTALRPRLAVLALTAVIAAAGCASGATGRTAGAQPTQAPVTPASSPSAATAAGWAAKWCTISPGAARADVERIMGPPTSSSPAADSWYAYEWGFTAFYSTAGPVRQLDVNLSNLTDAERGSLGCGETRATS